MYFSLYLYIYKISEHCTALFIWQTTLSKRHLDRKFHGMFVSLPVRPTRSYYILYCRILSAAAACELSKLCINHRRRRRTERAVLRARNLFVSFHIACHARASIIAVQNSYTQISILRM